MRHMYLCYKFNIGYGDHNQINRHFIKVSGIPEKSPIETKATECLDKN